MDNKELIYTLRTEAWEIDQLIKRLQKRSESLTVLADGLEAPIRAVEEKPQTETKFRKIVDSIYGEKPKRK